MNLPVNLPLHLPNSHAPAVSPADILAARGYHVSAETSSLSLAPVCALALHFGDRLMTSPDGMPELLIRAGLEVGITTSAPSPKVTHWTLRKSDLRFARGERIRLTLEIDLFLTDDTTLENLRVEVKPATANLDRLVKDARTLLSTLVTDKTSEGPRGPVLRLEARFIGDLFAGRCGLISAGRAPMSLRHQAASLAGCDWLKETILPDLTLSLRGQSAAAKPPDKTVDETANKIARGTTRLHRTRPVTGLAMAEPPR
jgi:hypothetical protein